MGVIDAINVYKIIVISFSIELNHYLVAVVYYYILSLVSISLLLVFSLLLRIVSAYVIYTQESTFTKINLSIAINLLSCRNYLQVNLMTNTYWLLLFTFWRQNFEAIRSPSSYTGCKMSSHPVIFPKILRDSNKTSSNNCIYCFNNLCLQP